MLTKTDPSGASLYRTNVEYADLRGVKLTGADPSNVRLRGAHLTNVILDNAILRTLIWKTQFYLEGVLKAPSLRMPGFLKQKQTVFVSQI